MTEQEFIYYFEKLIGKLDNDYEIGNFINGDVTKIDKLCRKYLAGKKKLYKRMRMENKLDGAD